MVREAKRRTIASCHKRVDTHLKGVHTSKEHILFFVTCTGNSDTINLRCPGTAYAFGSRFKWFYKLSIRYEPQIKAGALIDAPLIPAGFRSFLRNPVEFIGIKFGRDTSQNDIPGDEYSCGMRSFLISHRNGPRNGQKGMQPECNNRNTYYYY